MQKIKYRAWSYGSMFWCLLFGHKKGYRTNIKLDSMFDNELIVCDRCGSVFLMEKLTKSRNKRR